MSLEKRKMELAYIIFHERIRLLRERQLKALKAFADRVAGKKAEEARKYLS